MKRGLQREVLRICKEKLLYHPMWAVKCPKFHFSFIIQDETIIAHGVNMLGEPRIGWPEKSNIHSEYSAWKRAKGILDHNKRWYVVNVRTNKKNKLRLSAPCSDCARFLYAAGAHKVIFSTNVGWAEIKIGSK